MSHDFGHFDAILALQAHSRLQQGEYVLGFEFELICVMLEVILQLIFMKIESKALKGQFVLQWVSWMHRNDVIVMAKSLT